MFSSVKTAALIILMQADVHIIYTPSGHVSLLLEGLGSYATRNLKSGDGSVHPLEIHRKKRFSRKSPVY